MLQNLKSPKKPKKAQKKLKIDVKTAQMGSKTGFLALMIFVVSAACGCSGHA
jgi:hypothetical protein